MLLARLQRTEFCHRFIIGSKKVDYFNNPKRPNNHKTIAGDL